VGWVLARSLAMQVPGVQKSETERRLTFPGGGWVQVKSADDPDSLRGQGLDYLVVDEAAFVPERGWIEALRPALTDRRGGALRAAPEERDRDARLLQAARADRRETKHR